MKVLVKNALIFAPSSPFHGQRRSIFIEDGFIKKIAEKIEENADEVIQSDNLCVSSGWMDCFANFCDPGEEFKETLRTGAEAAAAGGFTEVMVMPNTQPPVSNKSAIEYIIQKSKSLPVKIQPIGAITQNAEGKLLSEMFDMFESGAIAFSDGIHPVQSSGMLQKALEYILPMNATIIQLPDDKSIGTHGMMNEGPVSVQLGLPGKPALSEELMIQRDIELAKYTGSKIHFTGVSTKKSLDLISSAKEEGIAVSCSVTPYHLFFSDDDLKDYDTNLKVNPPLRSKEDREALLEGIKSGTVDFIASHHQPQNWDQKECEFQQAKYGMETLECVFGAALQSGVPVDRFIKMQTENIRETFNLEIPRFEEGEKANLTLFDSGKEYIFDNTEIFSKSKNNAFVGKKLKGIVIGIINQERLFLPGALLLRK